MLYVLVIQQPNLEVKMLHAQLHQSHQNAPKPHLLHQETYLTNNWRSIQADNEYKDYTKYLRVVSGTANITNGRILIRSPVNVPDGFYIIAEGNEIIRIYPSLTMNSAFPDVDSISPNFNRIAKSPPIEKKFVSYFIGFLNEARRGNREMQSSVRVLLEDNVASVHKDLWVAFPVAIPVNRDGLVLDANHLRLAFTEMLRYDYIHIYYDVEAQADEPLVIGHGWNHCAIIGASSPYAKRFS